MKSFSILAIIAIAIGNVRSATGDEDRQACLERTGVDKNLVDRADHGDFVSNPELKKFVLCLSQKNGVIDGAGRLNLDVLRRITNDYTKDAEYTEKLIRKCALDKNTPEQTAFDIGDCYYKELKGQNM